MFTHQVWRADPLTAVWLPRGAGCTSGEWLGEGAAEQAEGHHGGALQRHAQAAAHTGEGVIGLCWIVCNYYLQDNSATQAAVLVVVSHVLTAASESLAGERR